MAALSLPHILLVALGGALGSVLRHVAGVYLRQPVISFPWPTFSVNVLGSFAIGVVLGYATKHDSPVSLSLFFATGFCGGFTTFSALSAESVALLRQGQYPLLFLYLGGSLLFGILAAYLGFNLSKFL